MRSYAICDENFHKFSDNKNMEEKTSSIIYVLRLVSVIIFNLSDSYEFQLEGYVTHPAQGKTRDIRNAPAVFPSTG
jgi:hypothetical protein